MCGIAGIYNYRDASPVVDRKELRAIQEHMRLRGPDGEGEWFSEDCRIGLAHRRLSIIDLSTRATQPMISKDGRYVVCFNGEIYNYRQLRQKLELNGRVFNTESDTEVLLHLYAEKGEVMLNDLRGMYAFVIWDTQCRELFAARDPFGIKPLYFADDGRTFRFASQVKALLAGGQVDTTPEPAGHAGFYLWGSVPEPWTLYAGIRSLQAGHFIKVSSKGSTGTRPFCRLTDVLRDSFAQPASGSRNDALCEIAAAVQDSVRAHLVADVPVGSFLSAGLDSAMISALAGGKDSQLHTLTLSFEEYIGRSQDEAPLAERLSSLIETCHTTVRVRQHEFEEERDKLLYAMDQPSIDGVNTWFIARAASKHGMKVALSGIGGDELFASYPSFHDVPRISGMTKRFATFPGIGRLARQIAFPILRRMTSPKYAGLLEYGPTLGGAYLLRRGLYMHWELHDVYDPDMVEMGWQELNAVEELNRVAGEINLLRKNGGKSSKQSIHTGAVVARGAESRMAVSALEMSFYMRNQLLRDADWAGMAHSLEIRVPFVDIDLLRRVTPWLAAYPDIKKSEIAAELIPEMPSDILDRTKTGFSIPVREWLLAGEQVPPSRGLRGWSRYIHGRFTCQSV